MSASSPAAPGLTWPELEGLNWLEFLDYLGASPLAESPFAGRLRCVITGVLDNTFNGITRTWLSTAGADRVIQEMLALVRARGLAFQWYLNPEDTPVDLARRLESQGWCRLADGVGMAADLRSLSAEARTPPGLSVRRATTEADLALWFAAQREADSLGDDADNQRRRRLYLSLGLDADRPLRHYVALLDGEPVGASSLFLSQGAAGLYNVVTVPRLRRRGIGSAVALMPLVDARRLGYRVGVLGPTPESQALYARLGFVLHASQWPSYMPCRD